MLESPPTEAMMKESPPTEAMMKESPPTEAEAMMKESPPTEAMMIESPPTEATIESPFSEESPITRAMVESPLARDYVAGNDKYVIVFDPADMVKDSDWRCSCGGHMKDEGYDDGDDGEFEPFVRDPDPFVIEPSPATDVIQLFHYVDGNPDNLEQPDLASWNLDAFMPLFAQIALDTYHPLRDEDGPVKLYFVKMGNVCSKPDRKDRPRAYSYHFNFWATYLGPDDNVDPTQLTPDHDMVGNFFTEVDYWRGDVFNRFSVDKCYEVVEEHDKVDYGCNICAHSNFEPPVLHRCKPVSLHS